MKTVTLYTVQSASYALKNGRTAIERYALQPFPDGSVGFDVQRLQEVKREEIPIHHIRECGRDSFIAVEPRLREMIELPMAEKLESARHEVLRERHSLNALTQKVVNFEHTSLWRRLWIAYKGRLP